MITMITTPERVRKFGSLRENIEDSRLEIMIEIVEDYLKGYTNYNDLSVLNGIEFVIINIILFNLNKKQGVSSENLAGDYSISYMGVDIPLDLLKTLKRKGKFI